MCSRRNKPILQGAVLLALVGGLAYTFYLYNLTIMDLETSRSEADKYLKQQESLSSQLQGQLITISRSVDIAYSHVGKFLFCFLIFTI